MSKSSTSVLRPPPFCRWTRVPFRYSACNHIREATSRHGTSHRHGLILIRHFPLSLLFHSHRSLPVPIRGYHLQILLTLHWLPYTSFLPPLSPSLFFPILPHPHLLSRFLPLLLYMPIICPHSCYIGLYCTISSYTVLATCDDVDNVIIIHAYTAATFNALTLLVGRQEGHPVCKN